LADRLARRRHAQRAEANTLAPVPAGLRELGYVEGKNILIDARWSEGNDERLARTLPSSSVSTLT